MRKTQNKTHIEGRVYDFTIAEKVTGETSKNPGTKYIGGKLDIATDEACLNVVRVEFTYITELTKAGKVNATYGNLKKIIDSGKTVLKDGKDAATMVKIDSAIGLNDFYTDRNGSEELVSAKINQGGFVTLVSSLDEDETKRNTFECDMLINKVTHVDADEERHIENDYVTVAGAIFDYRNAILPTNFVVKSDSGMKYFESLDVSGKNPVFTRVWGKINCETTVRRVEEESAFGEPSVKEFSRTVREWIITGTSKPDATYEIGDEEKGITMAEVEKLMADRNIYLADIKKKQDDYKASKAGTEANVATASAAVGGFNF